MGAVSFAKWNPLGQSRTQTRSLRGRSRRSDRRDERWPSPPARPGESLELLLTILAPTDPGSYVMELDLVQSGVAWFADKGSRAARVRVEVVGRPRERDEVPSEPGIEMGGVPHEEVVGLVERSEGKVLDAQEDAFAGPPWLGFRYFVGKRSSRRPRSAQL